MPQEAETDQLGLRVVDAGGQFLGAKPPKTTEWTAPMRAQASMAKAASGPSACR
jgi:hypothetical protein